MAWSSQAIAIGALKGLLYSTGFVLVLFIGFLVIAGRTKFRTRGSNSLVVRNLAERMGSRARYLPPNAPRGPADQLHTPELSEQPGRNP